jgi:hypothetical protein
MTKVLSASPGGEPPRRSDQHAGGAGGKTERLPALGSRRTHRLASRQRKLVCEPKADLAEFSTLVAMMASASLDWRVAGPFHGDQTFETFEHGDLFTDRHVPHGLPDVGDDVVAHLNACLQRVQPVDHPVEHVHYLSADFDWQHLSQRPNIVARSASDSTSPQRAMMIRITRSGSSLSRMLVTLEGGAARNSIQMFYNDVLRRFAHAHNVISLFARM